MHASRLALATLALGSFVAFGAACGDDTEGSGGAGGGTGGAASSGVTTADTTSPSATSTASSTATATSTGSGEGGGDEFVPDAGTIQFSAENPLPAGEQILFNDWNASPNTVGSMTPTGDDAVTIFEAYRVWSMGVSHDGQTIAFASGDPEQEAHYGTALGDAIQHTFLYDAASEEATALLWGNVNDECHTFSTDDATLYVCRRSGFETVDDMFLNEGYDIARVDLGTGAVELLLPDDDDVMTLSPQPDADEETILFQWIDLPSSRSIRSLDVASGDVTTLRTDAGNPELSPDGTRYLYTDYGDGGTLWAADVAGGNEVLVVDVQASGARWSPDGTRVVYTVGDDEVSCSHVEVVAADGSEAASPTRIRDCVESGEFITDLAWITR